MATLKTQPIHVRAGYSGDHGRQGDEAASQTFKVGNLISPDANGKYAATAAGAPAATAKNRVAMSFGQNNAAPARRVEYQDPNLFSTIEVTAGGAASSASNIKAGLEYGYAIDATTGLGYLDLTNTTNKVFRIEDSKPVKGAIGDTNVTVVASFVAAAR